MVYLLTDEENFRFVVSVNDATVEEVNPKDYKILFKQGGEFLVGALMMTAAADVVNSFLKSEDPTEFIYENS